MGDTSGELTELLKGWSEGDKQALNQVMAHVHSDLRRIAQRYMSQERKNHTLQATALVNEVYLHLNQYKSMAWQNRAHFYAMVSTEMRRILVDHARQRKAAKRGGAMEVTTLDEAAAQVEGKSIDVLALNEALDKLAIVYPERLQIVEMRYFLGMSVAEVAQALGLSPDAVHRRWNTAKVWLRKVIETGTHEES